MNSGLVGSEPRLRAVGLFELLVDSLRDVRRRRCRGVGREKVGFYSGVVIFGAERGDGIL